MNPISLTVDPETNDIFLSESGNLPFSTTVAQCAAMRLKAKLHTFKGEWFLDYTKGVEYFDDVLVKSPNLQIVERVLRTAIEEDEDVREILAYSQEFDQKSRVLSVKFKARLQDGSVIEEEV